MKSLWSNSLTDKTPPHFWGLKQPPVGRWEAVAPQTGTSELPGNFPTGLFYFLSWAEGWEGERRGTGKMLICQEERSADKYPFQLTFQFER